MDIDLELTTTAQLHYEAPSDKFFVISQGSGRSGKTYGILQCIILHALENPYKNLVYSVVAETHPFLRRGAMRDFENIMIQAGLWRRDKWNKTEATYELLGNTIEFFSVDNMGKALGSARDWLFINEANNIIYEIAFQLIARTRKRCYVDYNPISEFWVHEEILDNPEFKDKCFFLKTTFATNEKLDKAIKDNMLARAAKDPNYKRIYVDGEMGMQEGTVYPHYKVIDTIPDEILSLKQFIGLDFGFTNDESSINEVYIVGNRQTPVQKIYVNELLYQRGCSNKHLTSIIKNYRQPNYLVVADSAEPKSISEIYSYGVNIDGVEKPPDSKNFGIELLKQAEFYVTKNSINTIKELRNYTYAKNRYGQPLKDRHGRAIPVDLWDHSLDNIRYCAYYHYNTFQQFKAIPKRNNSGLIPA